MITLALAGSLCGTVWRNLFLTQKFDDVFVYNKSAVVITELNQYYHHQLQLFPKVGYRLEDSIIEIYRFNSSCDRLPTNYNISHWHKYNVSGDQNYTHQYLLPGSTLNYTISPVDRDSDRVVDIDDKSLRLAFDAQLENTKGYMYVYITYGPEYEKFDSTKCQSSSDCTIVDYRMFKNGPYDNSYPVKSRGYHNIHTVHTEVGPQYQYTLDLAIYATTVDIKPAQHVCTISDVNEEERVCTVDLEFKPELVCFIAYTEFEGNSVAILNFKVTRQLTGILLTSVLPPALFLFVIFGCLVLYTIVKFCCCKRKNQYVPVKVDA